VRSWGWALAYVAAVWLQLTASSLFPPGRAAPDVFLVAVIAVGLMRGLGSGLAAGLLLGLTGDLIGGRLVGLGALTLAATGILAGLISRRVFRDNLLLVSAVALLLSVTDVGVYAVLGRALGARFDVLRALAAIGLPVGLYSAIAVPPVYALGFRRLNRRETGIPERQPLSGGDAR